MQTSSTATLITLVLAGCAFTPAGFGLVYDREALFIDRIEGKVFSVRAGRDIDLKAASEKAQNYCVKKGSKKVAWPIQGNCLNAVGEFHWSWQPATYICLAKEWWFHCIEGDPKVDRPATREPVLRPYIPDNFWWLNQTHEKGLVEERESLQPTP